MIIEYKDIFSEYDKLVSSLAINLPDFGLKEEEIIYHLSKKCISFGNIGDNNKEKETNALKSIRVLATFMYNLKK